MVLLERRRGGRAVKLSVTVSPALAKAGLALFEAIETGEGVGGVNHHQEAAK